MFVKQKNKYSSLPYLLIYLSIYIYIYITLADVSEDPFSFHQEESSEGLNPNFVVESILQRNKDLSFASRDNREGVFSRPARSFITEEILEALRKADRKGRDVVVGLSNACCKWGCSKSEISSLCWGFSYSAWAHTLTDICWFYTDKYHTNMHTQTFFCTSLINLHLVYFSII